MVRVLIPNLKYVHKTISSIYIPLYEKVLRMAQSYSNNTLDSTSSTRKFSII